MGFINVCFLLPVMDKDKMNYRKIIAIPKVKM